jgi:lipopolysaccharide transport system permease protein
VSAAAETHAVRIRPERGTKIALSELWTYRELLYFLIKRDLQIRYKQSFFGAGWAILQPLVMTAVFSLVFGRLVKLPSEGIPYPLFVLSALTTWTFVATSTSQAGLSLVADANLITKVYFPRLAIPLAKILALLIDLVIALVLLIVVAFLYGRTPPAQVFTLPLWLLLALGTATGVGVLASAVNVRYRDVAMILPLAVQIWLFMTPVAYPLSVVKGDWSYLYAVNPMASAISGVRWALLDTPGPSPGQVAISVASALALIAAALFYFRRTETEFADIV